MARARMRTRAVPRTDVIPERREPTLPDVSADELELLYAVTANPDEDTPRLIYADWLSEFGGPRGADRAELIRLMCAGSFFGVPGEGPVWGAFERLGYHEHEHPPLRVTGSDGVTYAFHQTTPDLWNRGFPLVLRVDATVFHAVMPLLLRVCPVRKVVIEGEMVAYRSLLVEGYRWGAVKVPNGSGPRVGEDHVCRRYTGEGVWGPLGSVLGAEFPGVDFEVRT